MSLLCPWRLLTSSQYHCLSSRSRARLININHLANRFRKDVSKVVVGMHAYTGCDSVSAFAVCVIWRLHIQIHCLVPRRLKCGKWKMRLHEPSRSIAQLTMGTFSVDAKDAGKDPMIPCAERKSHRSRIR